MLLWYACLVPLCVSVSSVCVCVCWRGCAWCWECHWECTGTCAVYMASSEPRGGEPLLIGQLRLICVSLWHILCQANITDCSPYLHTYLCMSTCDNLHLLYCTITHSYHHHHHSAPMLATTQQLQEVFTVCFTVVTVYSCVGYVHYVHSSVYSCNSWLVCEEMSLMTLRYCSCYLLVVTYQTARYWEL